MELKKWSLMYVSINISSVDVDCEVKLFDQIFFLLMTQNTQLVSGYIGNILQEWSTQTCKVFLFVCLLSKQACQHSKWIQIGIRLINRKHVPLDY